jgi:hypothetical protein
VRRLLPFLALFLAFSPPAAAYDLGIPPRAVAMGGAMQAIGLGTAGLYFNPATLAQGIRYAVDSGYSYVNPSRTHDFHVCVSDSQTNREVAGGFGYTYFRSEKDKSDIVQGHDFRAALAAFLPLGDVDLAFGAGFRYLKVKGGSAPISAPTLDAGILVSVNQSFHLGASGSNIIAVSKFHAPRKLGVGAGYTHEMFDVGADATIDFDSLDRTVVSPGAGIEFIAGGMLAIRAGFQWDRVADARRLGGGLAYVSKIVGVDVGYAHDLRRKDGWQLASSVRVFLP